MSVETIKLEATALWEMLQHDRIHSFLIEPIFFYGIAAGLLFFLGSLLLKETKAQKLALFIIAASALMITVYSTIRASETEAGYDQVVEASGNGDGFKAMAQLRVDSQRPFLILAAVAGLTILLGGMKSIGGIFNLSTIVCSLACSALGLWLYLKDASLYHPYVQMPNIEVPAVESGEEGSDDTSSAPANTSGEQPTDAANTPSTGTAAPASTAPPAANAAAATAEAAATTAPTP